MQQRFDHCENFLDNAGNPTGGVVVAKGLDIRWQDGPLGRGDERKEPNGTFVETVIAAALQRLQHYQSTQFACTANDIAIKHLQGALEELNARTAERENRQVEGTHTP
jgi:hypothetical protein